MQYIKEDYSFPLHYPVFVIFVRKALVVFKFDI